MTKKRDTSPPANSKRRDQPRTLSALVLDDSQFDRKNIRRLCRKADLPLRVEEISSICELDTALARTEYDLIMIDYSLPEGDGLEAVARVRAHERQARCATIMFTQFDQTELAVSAMQAGCDDYIAKDALNPDRMRASVLIALAGRATIRADLAQSLAEQSITEDQFYPRIKRALQRDVMGLIRDLHDLRAQMREPSFCPVGKMKAIEHQCIALWRRLAAPEMITAGGAALLPPRLGSGPDQPA